MDKLKLYPTYISKSTGSYTSLFVELSINEPKTGIVAVFTDLKHKKNKC